MNIKLTLAQQTALLNKETIKSIKRRIMRFIGRKERSVDYMFQVPVSQLPDGVAYAVSQVIGIQEKELLTGNSIFIETQNGISIFQYKYSLDNSNTEKHESV